VCIVEDAIALVPVVVPEALIQRAVRFVVEYAEALRQLLAEVTLVLAAVGAANPTMGLHSYFRLAEVRRSEQRIVSLR